MARTHSTNELKCQAITRPRMVGTLASIACLIALLSVVAQEKKKRRAKPPFFDKSKTKMIFFDDLFSNLVGERPDFAAKPTTAGNGAKSNDDQNATSNGFAWSEIVSATAIENEIKSLKLSIDKDVTTPSEFKGRGYLNCRRHYSMVAALMAVISEFNTDIRWKDIGPAARDVFSRSAANAKVGTQQTYAEAKLRKQDMQDLIGGGTFSGDTKSKENDWERIVERPPLMERISIAFEEKLQPSIANEDEFKRASAEMAHEAEILRMLAEILTREGMPDTGDDVYEDHCRDMKRGASDYLQAVKDGDYAKARAAAGVMNQACSNCHNEYQ
ncbi:MAG: hypothetical protein VB878_21655 [Pirellulaceae bacterium]